SIVVLRTAFEGLADENVGVVATAGFQEIPKALPPLPDNFRTTSFLPGFSMAKRCDLMVHHGGHGSCMTGVFSGTPALILPTYSERESNARRLVALGVAEQHVPVVDGSGEKHVSSTQFGESIREMLADSSYGKRAESLLKKTKTYSDPNRIREIGDRIEALL
ncbi:MAG: hypothetical protein GY866_17425, partial [Proteobacteria bacterium]|nr:hypothetical protein [Pseudomonadota bacterium]